MGLVAILADVENSRRKRDRRTWAKTLSGSLDRINTEHQGILVGAFEPQKGVDEFGGLVRAEPGVGQLLVDLWFALHPTPVRFGVARGDVDVLGAASTTRPASVREFDGPAFHTAAAALREMRKYGEMVRMKPSPLESELLANALYLSVLRWTPRQLEVFRAYRRLGDQSAAAEELGITQPVVSEVSTKLHFHFYDRAFTELVTRIDRDLGGSRQ